MTKDVLVSISGMHMGITEPQPDEGDEPIEVVTPASYYCRNGKHYIIYDEVMEGMAGTIRNKIKITGDASVEIMKSGVSGTHMVFEKNKKNLTYYKTPYGQMLIGINTKNMKVSVSEDNIDVLVDYELDVNHEPLADCKIRMNITSDLLHFRLKSCFFHRIPPLPPKGRFQSSSNMNIKIESTAIPAVSVRRIRCPRVMVCAPASAACSTSSF